MMRATIACPEALIDAANALAMVLGTGPDEGRTFADASWENSEGVRFACASLSVSPEWLGGVGNALVRPAWDTDAMIDMDAARIAQGTLALMSPASEVIAEADGGALVAVVMDHAPTALALLGLLQIAPEA